MLTCGFLHVQVRELLETWGRLSFLRVLPKKPGQTHLSAYCLFMHSLSTVNALKGIPELKVSVSTMFVPAVYDRHIDLTGVSMLHGVPNIS